MAKHIVVIDDDRVTLSMISDFLSSAGFQVSTADCGVYSNHLIYGKRTPDLIVLDVMMPLLSGDKKVRMLKRREKSRDIPILLISSKSEQELSSIACDSGADAYLTKPFNADTLIDKIRNTLVA